MKTKIALIVGASLITLSFTVASVKTGSNKPTAQAEQRTKEPIGGLISQEKL